MSDKRLTEQAWKAVAAKYKVKETTLQKMLAALEKVPPADFAERLKLMAEIRKEADTLQKTYKSKMEVTEYLDDMTDVIAREEKEIKAKQAAAEKEGDEAEGEEDHSVDPAKLKAKVLGMLGQVKARPPEGPQLTFMAAISKARSGVLLAPQVGNTQKAMLQEILAGATGVKFWTGECRWEENVHTFVLEKVPGGLSKKLQRALLDETGTKFRVRVRSFDGLTVTDSETEVEVEEPEDSTAIATGGKDEFMKALAALKPDMDRVIAGKVAVSAEVQALLAQIVGLAKGQQFGPALADLSKLEALVKTGLAQLGGATSTPKPVGTDLETDFRNRLAALVPKIKIAMAGGGSEGEKLRARAGEANALLKQGNVTAALAVLAELEQQTGGGTNPKPTATLPLWEGAVEQATAQLEGLRTHLRQTEDPQMEQIADGPLQGIANRLTSSLRATLADFDRQAPGAKEALPGQVEEFRAFLGGELVTLLDANPFQVNVALRNTLAPALDSIVQAAA